MSGVKSREQMLADVVKAWADVPTSDKPDLYGIAPDLCFAVARLAASEVVRSEISEERAEYRRLHVGAEGAE